MRESLLVLLWMLLGLSATAAESDSLATDTISGRNAMGVIRRTVREFDRLNDEYIEPQHYEFTVMGQITRTYESFILGAMGSRSRCRPTALPR